jgi:hypothetical protein
MTKKNKTTWIKINFLEKELKKKEINEEYNIMNQIPNNKLLFKNYTLLHENILNESSKFKKSIYDESINLFDKNYSINLLDNNNSINLFDNNNNSKKLLLPINDRRTKNTVQKIYKLVDKYSDIKPIKYCWSNEISESEIEIICNEFKNVGLITNKRSSHVPHNSNEKKIVFYDNKNKDLKEIEIIRKEFNEKRSLNDSI